MMKIKRLLPVKKPAGVISHWRLKVNSITYYSLFLFHYKFKGLKNKEFLIQALLN